MKKGLFEYIRSTWYDSRFKKWMIYQNPAGWANTNNPNESFNAVIKRDSFLRKTHSVFGVVLKLEEILKYYSNAGLNLNKFPKYDDDIHLKAKYLTIDDFKQTGPDIFKVINTTDCKNKYKKINHEAVQCGLKEQYVLIVWRLARLWLVWTEPYRKD